MIVKNKWKMLEIRKNKFCGIMTFLTDNSIIWIIFELQKLKV